MNRSLLMRMVWRQARGARGRLSVLALCIAVGVAAVVGVAALVEGVERGIRGRSRELLGGDLVLESRRPLPDTHGLVPRNGSFRSFEQVDLCVLSTMASNAAGSSRLVEVKAVDTARGRFPLAGKLDLTPDKPLAELLNDQTVLVARELLATLALKVGEPLRIGGRDFVITGVVEREPDPLSFSLSLGPRVLMTRRGIEATQLLGFGSRVVYKSLFAFAPQISERDLSRVKASMLQRVPGGGSFVNVETRSEAQPALRRTLDRTQRYLGLVALLSLLVASVGVAQTVSTWLRETIPQVAALRCLGLESRDIFKLYLGIVVATAGVGSVLGASVGALLPGVISRLDPTLIPPELATFVPFSSLFYGLALGIGVSVMFSLPAMGAVWQVSPARVLRSEAAPLPVPRGFALVTSLLVVVSLFAAAFAQSRQPLVALGFAAGVSGFAALLWAASRALLWLLARLPRDRLGPHVRHGLAAVSRPGAGSTSAILALGLGMLVVLSITLVEDVLGREIHSALPAHAPSMFLVDIQPDQWPSLDALARARGATHVQSVPVVMARLAAIDGKSVDALLRERPGSPNEKDRVHWVLTREQRISWVDKLPDDNKIIEGALWRDPHPNEVSLELDFARDLGAKIGSVLRFDVQGVPMDFKVTSLRSVVWRSFSMNFFMFVEPGSLDDAPQIRLGGVRFTKVEARPGAREPREAEQAFQDELALNYPNVTVLKVQDLLERAGGILEQAALGVRLLGSFAVITGLLILIGAVAATQMRRAREAALLKALGLGRISVVRLFAVEYVLLGTVAGLLGAGGSYLLTSQVVQRVLEMDSPPSLGLCALGFAITVVLSTLGGLLASLRALLVPPLEVLRQEG